MDMADRQFFPQ